MAILPPESIASPAPATGDTGARCASCAAPLAADQRYCLECGERRASLSSLPTNGPTNPPPPPAAPPAQPPRIASAPPPGERGSTPTVIAGVGVLLLAMGVGVLIGRAGNPKQAAAPAAQVLTVADGASQGTSTTPSEASFSDDWPSGTSGYTVQLQTLPQSGTTVSAVEAAKTAATGKGAKAVGALKSEDFSSLTPGSYVIYAGVYRKRAEAEKQLGGLRKSFSAAKVISVANGSSAAHGSEAGGSSAAGVGSSESKPAPPSVLNGLSKARGKSYEEKSKSLPDVVSTG